MVLYYVIEYNSFLYNLFKINLILDFQEQPNWSQALTVIHLSTLFSLLHHRQFEEIMDKSSTKSV